MGRTSLVAFCLAGFLAGCAGDPARPVASSASPAPAPAPAPPTPASARKSVIPGARQFDVTELRPGDCVEPLPETFTVTVVPCEVPHSGEFAVMYVLPEGPFPGADMWRLAENGCVPRMRIEEEKSAGIDLWAIGPGEADWPRYRTVYCLAVPLDGGKTTGRVVK